MVYKWLNFVRSRLIPARCRLCLGPGHGGVDLCRACREELPWLPRTCQLCALPLPEPSTGVMLCPACRNQPPALDSCIALFGYQPPVDQWIHGLKFGRDLAAARLLGELLADRVATEPQYAGLSLLPVPLHAARLRQRGYNQSLEIARALLGHGMKLSRAGCRRHRHTHAQSDLPAKQRRQNIRGAFSVGAPLTDQRILLVDDVMTTGATLNELAHTLKVAGATRVDACVVARTFRRNRHAPFARDGNRAKELSAS